MGPLPTVITLTQRIREGWRTHIHGRQCPPGSGCGSRPETSVELFLPLSVESHLFDHRPPHWIRAQGPAISELIKICLHISPFFSLPYPHLAILHLEVSHFQSWASSQAFSPISGALVPLLSSCIPSSLQSDPNPCPSLLKPPQISNLPLKNQKLAFQWACGTKGCFLFCRLLLAALDK